MKDIEELKELWCSIKLTTKDAWEKVRIACEKKEALWEKAMEHNQ